LLPPKKSSLPTSRKLDIKYKTTIYRLLERHEWHKIVPRPKHPKEDSQAQEEFKNFALLVEQINQTRAPEDTRPLLLMAADEGKFGRIGEVRSCWCPKGIRPTVPKQQVRQYVSYAAVAPALGQMTCPDSALCQYQDDEFILHQVSVELADYFIVMVDKASGIGQNI